MFLRLKPKKSVSVEILFIIFNLFLDLLETEIEKKKSRIYQNKFFTRKMVFYSLAKIFVSCTALFDSGNGAPSLTRCQHLSRV